MTKANPDLQKSFQTNTTYYEMMRKHNAQNGEVPSVEEEIVEFILECKDGEEVLDAGAGEGYITVWAATQLPKAKITGVDLSPVGISMGQKLAKKNDVKNLHLQVDNLEKLSLKDATYDRVFSQSVVEHVPDLSAMLGELYRVMKPGAEGIIRVSNAASGFHFSLRHYLFSPLSPISSSPNLSLDEGNYYQHRHNFDAHELPCYTLVGLLKKAGFEIVRTTTFPRHLRNEPGSVFKRILLNILLLLRKFPFIKMVGPTCLVQFRKTR